MTRRRARPEVPKMAHENGNGRKMETAGRGFDRRRRHQVISETQASNRELSAATTCKATCAPMGAPHAVTQEHTFGLFTGGV